MSYYLVILFFLASCSILGMFKIDKKLEYSLLFISFLALFLFSGLRYDVGMDYSSYEQLYRDSLFQLNPEIKELGWAYLFYWCRNIGISFSIIILLISFFTIYCVFVFIRRYSPYPFLSILIFFCFAQYYTYTFNVIRQCLAIYIFFTLLECICQRKMAKYFISIALTVVFVHSSAIILFPLYFLLHRYYSLYVKIVLIVIALFCAKYLIVFMASSESYKIYLAFEQFAEEITITSYLLILITSFFIVLELFIKNRIAEKNVLFNISFLSLLCFTIACFFAGTPLVIVVLRLAFYFTPVLIVLLPLIVQDLFRYRSQCIMIFFITVVYTCLFCYTISTGGEKNKLIPYKTILSKQK